MSEYIDREKIVLKTCSDCARQVDLVCRHPEPCGKLISAFLCEEQENVAPVVHGKWIFNDGWWEFICTNCHKAIENIKKYEYCPHCGAKIVFT